MLPSPVREPGTPPAENEAVYAIMYINKRPVVRGLPTITVTHVYLIYLTKKYTILGMIFAVGKGYSN